MPNKNEIQKLIITEGKDLFLIYSTEAAFSVYFEGNLTMSFHDFKVEYLSGYLLQTS